MAAMSTRTRKDIRWALSVVLVSGAIAAFVACEGDPAPCGPSNCDGCCTADGRCEAGTAANACGGNGNACGICTGLEACLVSACVPMTTGQDGGPTPEDAGTTDAGTTDAGTDGGTTDAGTTDAGSPPDGGWEGIVCGELVCTGNDICCADFSSGTLETSCAVSCPAGQATIACDGPEDCGGGTPYCCGDVVFGAGSLGSCPVDSLAAACAASCAPYIPFSCSSQGTVAPCHVRSHCADFGSYSECCSFELSGASATFCVTTLLSSVSLGCHL
jgi:hypothetical protein